MEEQLEALDAEREGESEQGGKAETAPGGKTPRRGQELRQEITKGDKC